MTEKEAFQQKVEARLAQWKADLDKLKAKASEAGADAQLELNDQIKALKGKIEEGKNKLAELKEAGEGAWESVRDNMESAWNTLAGEKDLFQQKVQAQLNEWKTDLDILKTKASVASADAQEEMHAQIAALETRIAEGKGKLAELKEASEDAWESLKNGMESAWDSLKSAAREATEKFKK